MGRLSIRTEDAERLLDLQGEVAELTRSGRCAREHWARGLARLIDADVGVLFEAHGVLSPAPWHVAECLDFGWGSADERARVFAYITTHGDPLSARMADRARSRPRVVRRRDVVADSDWLETEIHRDIHVPIRLDDVVVGVHSLTPEGVLRSVVFKKRLGARPFTPEARDLVHLALLQTKCWEERGAGADLSRLAPRERRVLQALLSGNSEKEAAQQLGIAHSTLHTYVKALYRKLSVRSRPELLARYLVE
jgi:DNA-binding CsgD family transcriptional regulator